MILLDEYLNHWKVNYSHIKVPDDELTPEMLADAQVTVDKVNLFLQRCGLTPRLSSGWRPASVNRAVPGAAVYSNHTKCRAADLADPLGEVDDWALDHLMVLDELGLWLEHPAATKGWCHLQTVPPRSGKRAFYP